MALMHWDIVSKHNCVRFAEAPSIRRCDYEGYKDDTAGFPFANSATSTRYMPEGCVEELGGIIKMNVGSGETFSTWVFDATITPRATGVHNFWVYSDNGSHLYVGGVKVVANGGLHGALWQQGSVFLRKGATQELQVVFGNSGGVGVLKVRLRECCLNVSEHQRWVYALAVRICMAVGSLK